MKTKPSNTIKIEKRTFKPAKIFNDGYKVGRRVGYNKAIDDFVKKCSKNKFLISIKEMKRIAKELKNEN